MFQHPARSLFSSTNCTFSQARIAPRLGPRVSFGGCAGLFVRLGPRYIARMSEGPTYQVSIVQKQRDGRNDIRILLRTKDREAANYLVGSMEQDGQPCKLEVIPPGRGDL